MECGPGGNLPGRFFFSEMLGANIKLERPDPEISS
jgi:hypothetical protein